MTRSRTFSILGALAGLFLLTGVAAQAGDPVCQCTQPTPKPQPVATNGCPAGWKRIDNVKVTGCCTPVEAEYDSRAAFEAAVKVEGWGREKSGSYIGWWDNQWHHSQHALNAHNGHLTKASLAVDPSFIRHGKKVMIPGVSGDFTYTADDDGPDISGKHVNRWLGEGRQACRGERNATTFICVKK